MPCPIFAPSSTALLFTDPSSSAQPPPTVGAISTTCTAWFNRTEDMSHLATVKLPHKVHVAATHGDADVRQGPDEGPKHGQVDKDGEGGNPHKSATVSLHLRLFEPL